MSQLKSWSSTADGSSLLPQSRRSRTTNALMAANSRARSELGLAPDASQDTRGLALRMLRLQQQVDPAELATQACISLRQLFQLETGATSLFYSDSLRNQAGRRVAIILGANWDQLSQTPPPPAKHLRLISTPSSAESGPAIAQMAIGAVIPSQLPAAPHTLQEQEDKPGILMKPATETLVMAAEANARLSVPTDPAVNHNRSKPSWTLASWLLTAVVSGCGIWAAATTLWGTWP